MGRAGETTFGPELRIFLVTLPAEGYFQKRTALFRLASIQLHPACGPPDFVTR
jgi:hypothetical protein